MVSTLSVLPCTLAGFAPVSNKRRRLDRGVCERLGAQGQTSKLTADLKKAKADAGKGMMPGPDADPNSVQALCRQMVQEAGEAAEAAERKAEDLKEKYQQAMTRFDKEVTKSSALKGESEKLRRALQKECGLGDDAPLQRLLDEASDWRGRAQEISLLKGKVKELRNKLAAAAVETGSVMSDATEGSPSAFSSHETAVRKNLERLEKDRRGNIAMVEVRARRRRRGVALLWCFARTHAGSVSASSVQ